MTAEMLPRRPRCRACLVGRHHACSAFLADCGCLCRVAGDPVPDDASALVEGGAA